MDFRTRIQNFSEIINDNLDKYLPSEDKYPEILHKAMKYSVFSGGKRIRPILAIATCEAVGGNIKEIIPYACAIEMIHTYSLIHDDLPAMDNDDYRRGKLTNHKVFGEDMAILAGDALLNLAYEIMTEEVLNGSELNLRFVKAVREVALASGTNGMIKGQVIDLESEGKLIDKTTLNLMHTCKTGALIKASVRVGAIIGSASNEILENLTNFAENLGLAFQIRDDILDVIGDQAKFGKQIGSDANNNKATFVTVYGLEQSKRMVEETSKEAIKSLDILKEKGKFLGDLTEYLINRDA